MYRLGCDCKAPAERKHWLRMAAEEGHVPAMRTSAFSADVHEKRRWLAEAARNGWQAAILELAETGC